MATLNITEISNALVYINGVAVQVAQVPPVAQQSITITGTSTTSAVFNPNTAIVRLVPNANCAVAFAAVNLLGTTVIATAVVTSIPLYSGTVEYFAIQPGCLGLAVMTTP